ncbi:hypothetical protein Tco_1251529 [Tanacetum coccineum]
MVVRTVNVKNDYFQPTNDDEEILGLKVPYLSAMGALLFLVSHTRLVISFPLNLLARYSSCPTRRHWSGVKQILCYLQGTDLGLYYTNPFERNLVGFADSGYMFDPHTGQSQRGYVFTSSNAVISWRLVKQTISATSSNHAKISNAVISWRLVKQTISATSSNHAKILAIHEAIREYVWLRSVIQYIRESCGISSS